MKEAEKLTASAKSCFHFFVMFLTPQRCSHRCKVSLEPQMAFQTWKRSQKGRLQRKKTSWTCSFIKGRPKGRHSLIPAGKRQLNVALSIRLPRFLGKSNFSYKWNAVWPFDLTSLQMSVGIWRTYSALLMNCLLLYLEVSNRDMVIYLCLQTFFVSMFLFVLLVSGAFVLSQNVYISPFYSYR